MSTSLSSAIRRVSTDLHKLARSAQYLNDPVLWAKERMGINLWSIQRTISNSLAVNKKTAVKSCHGVGKSYLAAILICWWIDVHPSDDTVVVTTAPSDNQVKKVMWEYVRKLHRKHNLSGTVTENAEWKSDERNVVGYGRKPADTNMNVIQGEHKLYTLVIIDEAGAVPPSIWIGADAITTMDTNRILAIGNPDDPNNEFGKIFLKDAGYEEWTKFSISAFDSPNFTDEKNELPTDMLSALVSPNWVEDQKKKWGVNDRLYRTRVLAEFPKESFDAMFSAELIAQARDLTLTPDDNEMPVLGVDVARFGGDRTVVAINIGGVCSVLKSWDKEDLVTTAKRIDQLAREVGAREIRIDGTGVGAGVVDSMNHIDQHLYVVIEVIGSASSPDPMQWYNFRAYMYDNIRSMMRNNKVSLPSVTDPEDEAQTVGDEFENLRYKFYKGALLLESKDEMRRRGVKSPDYADAFAYATVPVDLGDPLTGREPGEILTVAAADVVADEFLYGNPIAPC